MDIFTKRTVVVHSEDIYADFVHLYSLFKRLSIKHSVTAYFIVNVNDVNLKELQIMSN